MSEFTKAFVDHTTHLQGLSIGPCPGCPECMERDGFTDAAAHKEAWRLGKTENDASFSWQPCSLCGTTLGGNREPFHYIFSGEIVHRASACTDCVMYHANGDEPEQWRKR